MAALLAAIGLYGVTSYSVTSRTRELAVRLALGSRPSALTTRVLVRGGMLAGAGLVIGILIVLALGPWAARVPFSLAPGPGAWVTAGASLLAIALLACLLPALRVLGVAPSAALRHE